MYSYWTRVILQVNKYSESSFYLQALSVRLLYNYIIAFVTCVHPWGEEQIKALSMLAL